jgi:hypothetical protein
MAQSTFAKAAVDEGRNGAGEKRRNGATVQWQSGTMFQGQNC